MSKLPDLTLRDADWRFLNFEGRADQFNDAGEDQRGFHLFVDGPGREDLAQKLAEDGVPVKWTKPGRLWTPEQIADHEPRPYLEVKVSYKFDDGRKPQVYLVTSDMKTLLDRETALLVDQSNIIKGDIVVTFSNWSFGGKAGIKPYLKQAYFVIEESELEREYSHIPTAGTTSVRIPSFD